MNSEDRFRAALARQRVEDRKNGQDTTLRMNARVMPPHWDAPETVDLGYSLGNGGYRTPRRGPDY